jgi:3-isopropylmalate/(R)-2-methylmalate dehydratase small subunit
VGLPTIECPDAYKEIDAGDQVKIDVEHGDVVDLTRGFKLRASPLPGFILELLSEGGLVPYLKNQIRSQRKT